MTKTRSFFVFLVLITLCGGVRLTARPRPSSSSTESPAELPQIQSSSLRIEFDRSMHSRVIARLNGREVALGPFSASETISGDQHSWYDFGLESQTHEHVKDIFGEGDKLTVTGSSGTLRKLLSITIYDKFLTLAVFEVGYTNTGKSKVEILGWTNNAYKIDAAPMSGRPAFWSFQSGSY